jgi:hypothetical protein
VSTSQLSPAASQGSCVEPEEKRIDERKIPLNVKQGSIFSMNCEILMTGVNGLQNSHPEGL